MQGLRKSAVAEFLGTFALCFIGAGAICTDSWTGGAVGLLGVAMAHGLTLAVMVSALGHISGGHFNPAVTLGLLAGRKVNSRVALVYIAFQLAGAAFAAFLLTFIIPQVAWKAVALGTPALGQNITVYPAILLETILTFFLVLAVYGTAADPKGTWNAIGGFGIGTVLIFDILVGGPLTGAAMNPARAFGPALVSGHWENQLVYWVGPILGGLAAGLIYDRVFLRHAR